ncbi:MAG TPA: hypothetical protein VHG90_06940 [Acidimicrobiales bacterium]|nr:hypothetical protein [Acidimicrobiales bacterium]
MSTGPTGHGPEARLVAGASAADRSGLLDAVSGDVDWSAVVALSERHGVRALLARELKALEWRGQAPRAKSALLDAGYRSLTPQRDARHRGQEPHEYAFPLAHPTEPVLLRHSVHAHGRTPYGEAPVVNGPFVN